MTVVVVRTTKPVVKVTQSSKPVVKARSSRGLPGIQGPQGPPGAAGAAPQSFTHIQGTPSAEWVIIHNLGYRPGGVHVTNSAGDDVEGDVHHDSLNQLTIRFGAPFSGSAYLS